MASNTLKPTKLQTALIALLAAQSAQAITLQPVQVLSSPDELLYAEIRFSQADTLDGMKVSVASPEDLQSLGIHEKLNTDNLNFYARSNSYGDGVITITSDKPINASELNVVIKIEQGNATRLQHVRTPLQSGLTASQIQNEERTLTPLTVAEQDISLNLPETSVISMPATNTETADTKKVGASVAKAEKTDDKNTTTSSVATPAHDAKAQQTAQAKDAKAEKADKATAKANAKKEREAKAEKAKKSAPATPVEQPQILTIQRTLFSPDGQVVSPEGLAGVANVAQQTAETALNVKNDAPPPMMGGATANNTATTEGATAQYVVKPKETLFKIASNIATQTNQPVAEVMQEIHKQNPDAFVKGKASRLRQGVTLNLAVAPTYNTTAKAEAKTAKPKTQSSAHSKKASAKARAQQARAVARKQRLAEAQMSLVAESKHDSAHGTAKAGDGGASTAKLNQKVIQAREKVVSTQKNVTSLENALKGKDQKVQMLNARLAKLEQQLKDQQASAVKQ